VSKENLGKIIDGLLTKKKLTAEKPDKSVVKGGKATP
jgi:hypothetical protein